MKVFAFAAGFALLAGTALADPVEGVWQTRKDDNGNFGHVEIKPCGPAFCGVLVRAFNGDGEEIALSNPVGLASRRTSTGVTAELMMTSSTPLAPGLRLTVPSATPGLEVGWQTSVNGHDWE